MLSCLALSEVLMSAVRQFTAIGALAEHVTRARGRAVSVSCSCVAHESNFPSAVTCIAPIKAA